MTDDSPLTRRKALAAGGSVAALALAGCAAEEGENQDSTSDGEAQDLGRPPTPPAVPDDEYWAFVVESLDYQNRALAQLTED